MSSTIVFALLLFALEGASRLNGWLARGLRQVLEAPWLLTLALGYLFWDWLGGTRHLPTREEVDALEFGLQDVPPPSGLLAYLLAWGRSPHASQASAPSALRRLIPGLRPATRQQTSPAPPTAVRGEDDTPHRRCPGHVGELTLGQGGFWELRSGRGRR